MRCGQKWNVTGLWIVLSVVVVRILVHPIVPCSTMFDMAKLQLLESSKSEDKKTPKEELNLSVFLLFLKV